MSPNAESENSGAVTWFVDEAGDPTLFGKGGKVVAATEGCSRFSLPVTRHLYSRLHGWSDHKIVFAQRGHKPRTKAFVGAVAHESEAGNWGNWGQFPIIFQVMDAGSGPGMTTVGCRNYRCCIV